jgi:hypothetical protein
MEVHFLPAGLAGKIILVLLPTALWEMAVPVEFMEEEEGAEDIMVAAAVFLMVARVARRT